MTTTALSSTTQAPDIVEKFHSNGLYEIYFNRPRQLNAISKSMLIRISDIIKLVRDDNNIVGLLLSTSEDSRAFSAGGDVKQVATYMEYLLQKKEQNMNNIKEEGKGIIDPSIQNPEACSCLEYITWEYIMDRELPRLASEKLVICLGNGIIMGAGAGIFTGGTKGFRIVTEKSLFAMPEAAIGLLPDAGAMYFLSQTPEYFGHCLALCGTRINGESMVALSLADCLIPSGRMQEFLNDLRSKEFLHTKESIQALVVSYKQDDIIRLEDTEIGKYRELINSIFSLPFVSEIYKALYDLKKAGDDINTGKFVESLIQSLERNCPLSHLLALYILNLAKKNENVWSHDLGLACEYISNDYLSKQNDFVEGVSCAIGKKKGMKPQWGYHSNVEKEDQESNTENNNDRIQRFYAMWTSLENNSDMNRLKNELELKKPLNEVISSRGYEGIIYFH